MTAKIVDVYEFDDDRIARIVQASGAGDYPILVMVGLSRLIQSDAGESISRDLWDAGITRGDVPLDAYKELPWRAAALVSRRVCERDTPAYFAYLLAHELGHALVMCTDLPLHVSSCLIGEALKWRNADEWPDHLLPQEHVLDQFAVDVASRLYGRDRLATELEGFLADPDRRDKDRLNAMLILNPESDLSAMRRRVAEVAAANADTIGYWTRLRWVREQKRHRKTMFDFADLDLLSIDSQDGGGLTSDNWLVPLRLL